MAFYATTMLAIALELAVEDAAYGDIASKFFEHFLGIARAMNELGGTGLWHPEDGFYYDQTLDEGRASPLRIRSMVGLIPLFAVESLDDEHLVRLPLFRARLEWFLSNRPALTEGIACMHPDATRQHRLLAIPSRERLVRVLACVLDEREFLSPFGVRSLSKLHEQHPYVLDRAGERSEVRYEPGESETGLFGGNSNWRGPVWLPVNYLLIEALKRYHHFYRDTPSRRMPDRVGTDAEPATGGRRTRATSHAPLPAG
jgi:glycogen debranching enzyme